ncbi:hypothetical protein F4780DRAFT_306585 [Xylariomycetidae sp. FL0641]|nr:hypothetical protein F4780DRAFT_306585 [Xylariomycetidae sp. FL0641]
MTYSQPNAQTSDELAALFSRNMTFQPQPVQQPAQEQPQQVQREPEPIIYSITQHYTHSAHINRQDDPAPAAEPQRPSSEPPQTQQPSCELILIQHGVDPTALSAAQLQLFKTAEDAQKLRLIELWRICPPTNGQVNPAVAWTNTTLEQEELLAQMRYEQKLAEEEQRNSIMSMDGTPLTPVQTQEGHWVHVSNVEPYMMSGYEALARREYEESAMMTEPKGMYTHFGSAVGQPDYDNSWARQQQAMEDQYGAYQMGGMEL